MRRRETSLKSLFVVSLMLFAIIGYGQEIAYDDFNMERTQITRNGMLVLGSWALGNIAVSGIAATRSEGENRYFHQMNTYWNLVNLGIAGIGYYNSQGGAQGLSLLETWSEQASIEKILLLNVGLDVAYMMGGAWMIERSKSVENSPRLKGFGRSIVLQGAFLFLFDVGFYAVHAHHKSEWFDERIAALFVQPNAFYISFNLD